MYHVALDLSLEQVRQLRVLAATTGTSIKDLVTRMVARELEKNKEVKTRA